MRFMEIANPEDQLALWRLVSDNVWGAFAQQPVWSKIRNTCWHRLCSTGAEGRVLGSCSPGAAAAHAGLSCGCQSFVVDLDTGSDGFFGLMPLFSVLLKPPIMRTSCLAAGPLSSVAQTSSG